MSLLERDRGDPHEHNASFGGFREPHVVAARARARDENEHRAAESKREESSPSHGAERDTAARAREERVAPRSLRSS
jgi:hypothetical protein